MAMTAELRAALIQRLAALAADHSPRPSDAEPGIIDLDCPAVDRVLPAGGLRLAALHEIFGPLPAGDRRGDGAAMAFAACLLGRAMQQDAVLRPAVWCLNRHVQHQKGPFSGLPYAPGLPAFGVAVERLLFLDCPGDSDTVWAAEEALRSKAAVAVVAELDRLEPLAARRLQLAAEAAGTAVLALRAGDAAGASGFAESRWRLQALPAAAGGGGGSGRPVGWRAELLRCRGLGSRPVWYLRWQEGRLWAERLAETPESAGRPPLRATKAGDFAGGSG